MKGKKKQGIAVPGEKDDVVKERLSGREQEEMKVTNEDQDEIEIEIGSEKNYEISKRIFEGTVKSQNAKGFNENEEEFREEGDSEEFQMTEAERKQSIRSLVLMIVSSVIIGPGVTMAGVGLFLKDKGISAIAMTGFGILVVLVGALAVFKLILVLCTNVKEEESAQDEEEE